MVRKFLIKMIARSHKLQTSLVPRSSNDTNHPLNYDSLPCKQQRRTRIMPCDLVWTMLTAKPWRTAYCFTVRTASSWLPNGRPVGVFTTPRLHDGAGEERIDSISDVFIGVCSDINSSIKTSKGGRCRSDWIFYFVSCTTRGEDMMAHRHVDDKVTKTEREVWLRLTIGRSLVKKRIFFQHLSIQFI